MSLVHVQISQQADEDVIAAALYYANVSDRVLTQFYQSLVAAQRHISRFPSAGFNRYAYELSLPNLRYWPLNGFPYALFYIQDEAQCTVIRCLHLASDIPISLADQPTLY